MTNSEDQGLSSLSYLAARARTATCRATVISRQVSVIVASERGVSQRQNAKDAAGACCCLLFSAVCTARWVLCLLALFVSFLWNLRKLLHRFASLRYRQVKWQHFDSLQCRLLSESDLRNRRCQAAVGKELETAVSSPILHVVEVTS